MVLGDPQFLETKMNLKVLAVAAALLLAPAGAFAAEAAMECCKDCACCKDKKSAEKPAAETPAAPHSH